MKMNKAYIDQECVMCTTYGNFLKKRTSEITIKNQNDLPVEDIKRDEIVYERGSDKFYGAEAFIQSTNDLGGIYRSVLIIKVFPKIFRDSVYRFIATNRHKIFKKNWYSKSYLTILYLNHSLFFRYLEQFMVFLLLFLQYISPESIH